jgi:hypothetical protein
MLDYHIQFAYTVKLVIWATFLSRHLNVSDGVVGLLSGHGHDGERRRQGTQPLRT